MDKQDKFQDAVAELEAHDDYRVVRRIPPATKWQLRNAQGQCRRGLFVDVETTGLDTETDEIIEVALLPYDYDPGTGEIVAVHEDHALDDFRDPGIPIPPEASQVNGITDKLVNGRTSWCFGLFLKPKRNCNCFSSPGGHHRGPLIVVPVVGF
ncbi:MAG: hypothetical protein GY948_11770 [Alphaproteobacteria bacterium]|nr:hypothetical protein [Alphaproteobacteria bacterium]